MTVDEIEIRVDELRQLERTDPEAAGAGAEELRVEALTAIADGVPNAQEIAAAAMMTVDEDIGGT